MKNYAPSCCRASSISPDLELAVSLESVNRLLNEAELGAFKKIRIHSAISSLHSKLTEIMDNEEINVAREG